jgi:phage-related minor tail protein
VGRERTLKVKITDTKSGTGFSDTEAAASSLGDKLRDTGSKLRDFGTKATTFLTLPLVAGGVAAFNLASDLGESLSKANTIFGSNAAAIEQWASTAASNFGQSKQQALEAAATFGNLFSQVGVSGEQTATMSQGLVELASDFASFHNADITEVIEAQTAAFRGEYDALQRFVPTINAAAVEQRALADTGKDSADSLTEAERAAATYALMMEGAGQAVGDFDRTADSAANQQRIMTARVKDSAAALGQKLIPIGLKVIEFVQKLVDWYTRLSPGWQQFILYAGLALAALGPLVSIVGTLATVIGFLLTPVGLVILAIAALIAVGYLLYRNWDTIKEAAGAAWGFIYAKVSGVFNWIAENWPLLLAILTGPIGMAVYMIVRHWDTITGAFGAAMDWIGARASGARDWIVSVFTGVIDWFRGLPGTIANATAGMWNGITSAFKSAINALIGLWNNFEISFGGYDIPGPGPNIPSFTLRTPNIPYLAEGGIVPATPGGRLAVIGEGAHDEAVIPLRPGMGMGGTTEVVIDMRGAIVADERQFEQMVVRALRAAGAKGVPLTLRGRTF